jgi:hypothetical protein
MPPIPPPPPGIAGALSFLGASGWTSCAQGTWCASSATADPRKHRSADCSSPAYRSEQPRSLLAGSAVDTARNPVPFPRRASALAVVRACGQRARTGAYAGRTPRSAGVRSGDRRRPLAQAPRTQASVRGRMRPPGRSVGIAMSVFGHKNHLSISPKSARQPQRNRSKTDVQRARLKCYVSLAGPPALAS